VKKLAIASERSITVDVKPILPEEIVTLAEQTWSPLPDLNFNYLLDWMAWGFYQVTKVGWLTRYGPAYGGPAILSLLRSDEGKEIAMLVAPGKKVAEFIRKNLEEWKRKGVPFERWEFLTQTER
jgi:hypothetical protein